MGVVILGLPTIGIPIYFIIALGEEARATDWEGLQLGLTHNLISIWSTWILTVSIAVYRPPLCPGPWHSKGRRKT